MSDETRASAYVSGVNAICEERVRKAVEAERERLLHMEPHVLARLAFELDHPIDVWCGCGHRWTAHNDQGCQAETGNYVYDHWCWCCAIPPSFGLDLLEGKTV